LLLLTFNIALYAQDPDTLWSRTYGGDIGDFGYSIQQTSDGGYIIAGFTSSFGCYGFDVYLIKTDAYGDTIWTNTLGWSHSEGAEAVEQTPDGGYLISGYIDVSKCEENIYLVKVDANGDSVWAKDYAFGDFDRGYSIKRIPDGGYIITGIAHYDTYLMKIDEYGDTLWVKFIGGAPSDWGNSVELTSDRGFIVAGTMFRNYHHDMYVVKTDSIGEVQWTKYYGGSDDDQAYSIQQTSDGGYVITGYTLSYGSGRGDIYLVKIDADGDTIWTRTYGKV